MSYYWIIGQAGIILEIIGAGTLVVSAWRASRKILKHKTDLDHIQYAVDELIEHTKGQFRTQSIGFVLLVIGLAMQFVGGFAP
jgi:hypothetical protein